MLFEIRKGAPILWRLLTERFGKGRALRIMGAYAVAQVSKNPFASLPKAATKRERQSRGQVAPVLLLDDVLKEQLETSERMELLGTLVAETGSAFLDKLIGNEEIAAWDHDSSDQKIVKIESLFKKFPNSEGKAVIEKDRFGFDVSHCEFVKLCVDLEREYLATLFCKADDAYFEKLPSVSLEREDTLANKGPACTFRFRVDTTLSGKESE